MRFFVVTLIYSFSATVFAAPADIPVSSCDVLNSKLWYNKGKLAQFHEDCTQFCNNAFINSMRLTIEDLQSQLKTAGCAEVKF
jgi:hypothetical protein